MGSFFNDVCYRLTKIQLSYNRILSPKVEQLRRSVSKMLLGQTVVNPDNFPPRPVESCPEVGDGRTANVRPGLTNGRREGHCVSLLWGWELGSVRRAGTTADWMQVGGPLAWRPRSLAQPGPHNFCPRFTTAQRSETRITGLNSHIYNNKTKIDRTKLTPCKRKILLFNLNTFFPHKQVFFF